MYYLYNQLKRAVYYEGATMKKFFVVFQLLLLCAIGKAACEDPLAYLLSNTKEEEALFLRRIVEFWEEKEYQIVKMQIEEYLENNKNNSSLFNDYLFGVLGDVFMQEKNFQKAAHHYSKITAQNVKNKIIINYLIASYEIKDFSCLTQEGRAFLKNNSTGNNEEIQKVKYLVAQAIMEQMTQCNVTETKLMLAKEAKNYFETLLSSSLSKSSTEALALISYNLQDFAKAAELYRQLSEKFKEEKETFLFSAATMEAEYDKKKAIASFEEVWQMQKNRAADALYNQALLFFQMQDYNSVVGLKDKIAHQFKEQEKNSFLHFFVGKSYFMLNDAKNGKQHLDIFLQNCKFKPKEANIAFETLLKYASQIVDLNLFDNYFKTYKQLFPNAENMGHVLFERILINKKLKNYQAAKQDVNIVLGKFPNMQKIAEFCFESAVLSFEMNSWQESILQFKSFTENFENHELYPLAWRYLINSYVDEVNRSNGEKTKRELIITLEKLLNKKNLLEIDRPSYMLLLAQTKYNLEEFDEALLDLKEIITKFPKFSKLAQVYLLAAFSCENQYKDFKNFCMYANKAAELNPKVLEDPKVLIGFFNAYIKLAEIEKCEVYLDKAATTLFDVYKINPALISQGNIVWLSEYYYGKVKIQRRDYVSKNPQIALIKQRAIKLKKALISQNSKIENNFVEQQILSLTDLCRGNIKKQLLWLNKLNSYYQQYPQINWLLKKDFSFAYACALEKNKQLKEAKTEFDTLVTKINKTDSLYPSTILHQARLFLKLNDPSLRNIKNREFMKMLLKLKDLLLNKNIKTEPCHFEAALEYVDLQCSLAGNRKDEKKLFLLARVENNFTNENTPAAKEYHQGLQDKNRKIIYDAYIAFIRAEIMLTRGLVEQGAKSQEYINSAKQLFAEIEKNNGLITPYLKQRFKKIT